jgi:hypothetical protein
LNPITLGPKINGARHGMCDLGPIVMDQAVRDPSGCMWARLRIAGAEWVMMYASDDDLVTMAWHGFITLDGVDWRVAIDPGTWVLTFIECKPRIQYVIPERDETFLPAPDP